MEISAPAVLKDKSRLKEIYDLRTLAYEHSYKTVYVNKNIFPDGWKDYLDEQAIHWVAESENTIVASARLVILNDLADTREDVSAFELPAGRPFAYYSRLVVHPEFRGYGIGAAMDAIRMSYIKREDISFAMAFSFAERSQSLLKLGFEELGIVNYKWCGLPLPTTEQHFFIFRK